MQIHILFQQSKKYFQVQNKVKEKILTFLLNHSSGKFSKKGRQVAFLHRV